MNVLSQSNLVFKKLLSLIGVLLFGLLSLLALPALPVQAQGGSTGADGDKVITDTVYIDTARYAITESLASGNVTLPFSDGVNIEAGDEILIINMQGNDAGVYETAVVSDKTTSVLTLTAGLTHSYDGTTDKVMVQRVPNYSDVRVEDGGTLTAHAWDGETGGVIFLRAVTVTVESGGTISADGLGYGYGQGPGYFNLGAGHGGYGGNNSGKIYDNLYQPSQLGSGGGGGTKGGKGGGSLKLDISNTLIVEGVISVNGQDGIPAGGIFDRQGGGGGSGGSVWIKTRTIAGSGFIKANGGKGNTSLSPSSPMPSGGGGRIPFMQR